MFACLLTYYIARHGKISSSLTCRRSNVCLRSTAPDTAILAAASHVHVRTSTYKLHHRTQQYEQQPRISVFERLLTLCTTGHSSISISLTCQCYAGLLTFYTAKRSKVSSSLTCRCSHVCLLPTPSDTAVLAAASHVNIKTSTYQLHHQTQQY
jgi:hypothetical protein